MEMPTRNPLAKGPGSNKKEGNVFAAPNKKDEDTLRRFQKMQIAKAFSSKSSGDHKHKVAGALAFMKSRSSQIKKKKKVRSGIHSTLEVIRRTSVVALEELRKDEVQRREQLKKMEEAKKRKKEKMAKGLYNEKKKMDPVGNEDGDVDNDGDMDDSDKLAILKKILKHFLFFYI